MADTNYYRFTGPRAWVIDGKERKKGDVFGTLQDLDLASACERITPEEYELALSGQEDARRNVRLGKASDQVLCEEIKSRGLDMSILNQALSEVPADIFEAEAKRRGLASDVDAAELAALEGKNRELNAALVELASASAVKLAAFEEANMVLDGALSDLANPATAPFASLKLAIDRVTGGEVNARSRKDLITEYATWLLDGLEEEPDA